MLLLSLLLNASATCPDRVGSAALIEEVARGERAFVERNPNGVYRATDEVRASLACLDHPVLPADLARIYVLFALRAFLERDRDAAIDWFEAARGVRPDQPLPDPSLPENHPLRELRRSVSTAPPARQALARPEEGWIVVDGVPNGDRPLGRPWLFQWVDPSEEVILSALVAPGAPVPSYAQQRPTELVAQAGYWHHPNASDVRSFGVLSVGLLVPASRRADVDLAAAFQSGGQRWVPSARAGVRLWTSTGAFAPYLGLVGTFDLHGDGGTSLDDVGIVLRPGAGVPVGIRLRVGEVQVEADLLNTLSGSHDGEALRLSTRALIGVAFPL